MNSANPAFTPEQLSRHHSAVDQLFDILQNGFSGHDSQQHLFNLAEQQLLAQISDIKLKHVQQFNSRQPAVAMPLELLIYSLSFLGAQEHISASRVCQIWRQAICSTPALWARIDGINEMSKFALALSRAQTLPIDISSLRIVSQTDGKLLLITRHLHHIQTLDIHLNASFDVIRSGTAAFTLFTTAAPLLTRITLTPVEGSVTRIGAVDGLFAGNAPQLRTFESRGVQTSEFLRSLQGMQSMRTLSFDFDSIPPSAVERLTEKFPNLTTMNMELRSWDAASRSRSSCGPSFRRLNIRWTEPNPINPSDVVLERDAWKLIPAIHVLHIPQVEDDASTPNRRVPEANIPATATPYVAVIVRTFSASRTHMHVRAVDREGRERVFCGLVPWSLSGMLARIPADQVSIISIGTSAAGVGFLTEARCPAVRAIRLILDMTDLAWVVVFARDILNFTALERLEFTIERTVPGTDWSTAVIMRILGSCLASGSTLLQVAFKGFSPDPGCLTQLGAFAREVVVEPEWVEPDNERRWFTHPCSDWL